MEHLNIGEFNRGQSSKLIRNLVEEDKAAFIQKNGKPIAVVISYERYQRMFEKGIDISEFQRVKNTVAKGDKNVEIRNGVQWYWRGRTRT